MRRSRLLGLRAGKVRDGERGEGERECTRQWISWNAAMLDINGAMSGWWMNPLPGGIMALHAASDSAVGS